MSDELRDDPDEDDGLQWFVVNHDDGDRKLRGPYDSAATAGAVRREMERGTQYDAINLWIVSESYVRGG